MSDDKLEDTAKNGDKKIPESKISRLIKRIRKSADYDNVSIELYAAMMCNDKADPPYSKWVATWILKCIKETFPSDPYKQDIMRASFALLPEYDLMGTTIQQRLERYLGESSYLVKYPSPSKRTLDEIKADPDGKNELDAINARLKKMDGICLGKLISYIENIDLSEVEAHLHNLSNYGKPVTLPGGKKGYDPMLEGLYYPKKEGDADGSGSEQKKPQNITDSEPLGDLSDEQKESMPQNIIDGHTEINKDGLTVKVRASTEYESKVRTESEPKKDTPILPDGKIGKGQSSDNHTVDGSKHKNRKLWFIVAAISISIGFAIPFLFLNINKEEYDQSADGSIYQPTPSMKVNFPDGTSLEFYGPIRYEETSDGCVIESISGEKKSLTGQLNKTVIDDDYLLEGVDESDKNY